MTDVKVGLTPSYGTGLVSIKGDVDDVVVMKITDKNKQKFKVFAETQRNGHNYVFGYQRVSAVFYIYYSVFIQYGTAAFSFERILGTGEKAVYFRKFFGV